ncbi:TPA: discoidin domain-containing protein [Streptococcus suis]|nr:discoidin domain-containing protein [Streptococcus suis]HEM5098840.1 discoidin domain-containing protein [Streptococcus suis]HEM5100999.1 discoidin domain-containing protein [Streptococcus suis]HEM5102618.1 discoidin domain-containing protein [Streptococcus suis]HEM5109016.1 discoidin domain-containing protein [Streptococcus suis]
MQSWKKAVSQWLLALLVVDSVATPVLALSETISEGVRIRDTYIKDYQEDASKLSLTIDRGQTNTEQLVVKLKAAEGEINEQGLTLVLQSGLALQQNDQGQDILPEGFYRDEAYNENDRKVAAAGSDALAAGLEQLPVYGEGYYSLKIKPSADRPVTLNTDPNDSSKRFEEHVFVFKKVAEVQTGEMVAMTNEHYLTILKENQLVFTNQETTEITASTEMPRAPGSLTIQLRAYEENNPDPKVPLTESEFEISPVDHPEQTTKGKTDLNGNVTFENIALGTYTIKQLTSTSSYNLAEQIEAVELTESEPAKTVLVINQPKESLSRAVRRTRSVSERAAVNTTLSPSVETYGITYANIDTFGYYQFQDGYSTYGAGMDIRWKLPAEAKEGDYFTLKFGNQILLNRAPMYDDNETVPYDRLDSVEDRYPDTHIGNLFFTVVTRQSATEPTGIPILNVYYTKAGELTFVVQKYANDKGPIEGDAIIGKLVDKYNLTAVTDGNGRHRGSKRIRPAGNGATDSRLDWDINDLDDQIKKYDFYEGFYPNYMLMTEQAGATPTNGNPWFLGRKIIYTSQYMNGTPIDLEDANGDPSKSGVYINQRTQLFETTHDFGAGAQQTSSYGRDALFPVYEDRNYLYHYFVYNGNRNATGPGAWEVYLRPTGSELQIVDIKLFEGYNGQYANSPVTSMVPPMATVDPNNPEAGQQVSTGKRFNPYNATEWMANWGGPEHNKTYLAIIKSKKKTPSAEAADLNRLGYHMGVHSRQSVFATRQIVDYYVPTEGFGAGWVVPKEPKDLLGNFKIQKTDPNKAVVYPNYQKVGDAIQYQDDHGNTYTYNSLSKKFVDNRGQSLSQKTDNQGNLLFENNLHKVFTQKKNGSTITYTDDTGIVYSKKAGEEDIYISPDGKVFRPSRPLLKDYDVTIKVEGTVVTDSGGKVYPLASQNNGILEVVDRFGNLLRVQKTAGGLNAWKFDPGSGSWGPAQVTSQGSGYYKISALPISTTHIRPKLTETFSFRITDTVTGLVFNHEVDEYGYAIFPSLLVGHTYRLEETSARVGYTRTPKVYLLTVTATGQITITDENRAPISATTDPLSVVDASNLLYSVVNDVVRLKIKKTDEDGRLITSDKATFKVYKSGDYTKNGNTIQPKAGAVPVATIQTSKVDGTNTLYGESEAVVIPNIMTNVNYGIVEETAPAGYRILTTGIEVKLVQSGSNYVWQLVSGGNNASLESDNLTLKVKNRADLATLVITKKIKGLESLNNLITSSVTFKLTKLNDTSFNPITLRQNANTRFVFNNLSKGVYRLEETEPPTGYVKSPTPYTVIVDKGRASLYQSGQGTTTQATGLTVIKSNHFDNAPLWGDNIEGRALDGSDSTVALYKLANNRLEEGQWWGVDLGEIKNVSRIRYLQGPAGGNGSDKDRMDSLALEYSVDGQNYQSLGTYNAPTGGSLGEVLKDTEVMARYIRVRNLRLKTNVWLAIKEMTITTRNSITPLTDGTLTIGNIQNPKLRIEKQDTNGQVISQNVTFKLYKVDDTTTADNVVIREADHVQTFELTNGQVSQNLQTKVLGRYALVETQAPTGYTGLSAPVLLELYEASQPHNDQLNKAVTRFRVLSQTDKVTVDDSTTATDNTLKMVVKNVRNTFNLKLLKRDLANPNTGLNARFELYNANEATPIGQGDTERDSNSLTFQNLSAGIYVLKEVTPPSGYIQVEPVQLEITQAGQLQILSGDRSLLEIGTSSGNTLQLTVKNDRLKTLRISKRIKGLENLPSLITGQMTFTLTKDNDANTVPDVQTHAANTDFVFNNLTYGSYTLVETAPPAGYMVEPIVYKVAVSRAGVSLYKVANAAPIERVTGATLIKSPDLSNIQSGQDGNAIDGSDTTSVTYENFNGQGNNIPAGAYLGVDLQGVKRVRHIHYLQGTQRNAHDRFNRFTLEYSIDGRTYFPLSTYTEHGLVNLNTDIVARYIRVRNEDRVEQKWYGVRELTVSAQEAESVSLQGGLAFPIGNIQHPEIQIEKQDMNNRIIQQAVTFKLYKVPDDATSQTVTSALTDQNLVQTFTLTNGQVRQTLEAKVIGRYALVEGAPPTGYRGLASPVLLDLQTLQQSHSGSQMKTVTRFNLVGTNDKVRIDTNTANVLKFIVKNEPLTYRLKILKRDVNNAATGLDARFELYDATGTNVIERGNTSQDGFSLTFPNLSPNRYVLKETEAPANYNSIAPIHLTIDQAGQLTIQSGPSDLIAIQSADDSHLIQLTIKNRPFTPISIQKVDKRSNETTLTGVRLRIQAKNGNQMPQFSDRNWHVTNYQGRVIDTEKALEWNSSTAGNAVFQLPQGTYTISELSAPAGYEQLQPFDITVAEDGSVQLAQGTNPEQVSQGQKDGRVNIKLTNVFKPKIKITKVDSRDANRKLAGARFKLFGPDENTQIGQEVTTDSNGEITLPGLEPGTYYLQESQPPTGYQANSLKYRIVIADNGSARVGNADNKIEVGTSQDQGADKIIPITVKNDRTPFTVKIRKRDYNDTNRGLNARFQLYRKDGDQEVLLQGLVGNTSGANSELLLPNLLPNTYVLKEITAPAGNYEAIRPIQFTITEEGRLQIDVNDRGFASVENGGNSQELILLIKNIKKFRLRIKKQDAGNDQTLLDGARFTLYRAQGNTGGKLEQLATGVTANGLADIDVGPGYFILQETQAPTGYVLNGKEYIFQINHDGTVLLRNGDNMTSLQGADSDRVVVFTMKNRRKTGQFKLAKRAYSDSDRRLAAVFELKEENGATPVATKTTATDGEEIVFDNLRIGQIYQLKETQAPEGYQLNTKVYRLRLTDSGQVELLDGDDLLSLDDSNRQLLTAKNLKKGEYPKTGGFGVLPYITLGGGMMLLALAVELGKEKPWKRIRK